MVARLFGWLCRLGYHSWKTVDAGPGDPWLGLRSCRRCGADERLDPDGGGILAAGVWTPY